MVWSCPCVGLQLQKQGNKEREQPPALTMGNPCPGLSQPRAKAVSPACPWQPGDSHPVVAWATSSHAPTLTLPLHR